VDAGSPLQRGALCHSINGTMVNPALCQSKPKHRNKQSNFVCYDVFVCLDTKQTNTVTNKHRNRQSYNACLSPCLYVYQQRYGKMVTAILSWTFRTDVNAHLGPCRDHVIKFSRGRGTRFAVLSIIHICSLLLHIQFIYQ